MPTASSTLMAQFIGPIPAQVPSSNAAKATCRTADGRGTVYETADGPHVSVGPLELQFFARLCELLQSGSRVAVRASDRSRWPALREGWRSSSRAALRPIGASCWKRTDACCARAARSAKPPGTRGN